MTNFGFHTTAEEAANAFAKEIKGKTVMMTGITQGSLGGEAALQIACHAPNLLILTGRNMTKLKGTEAQIKSMVPNVSIRLLELNLASQKQIKKAAEEVKNYPEAIDVLINSAAIMACPYATTEDGLESQFGTNHIGHFLFTNLIMEKILASGEGARIVNVSSGGHRRTGIRFDDYNFGNGETYNKFTAYGQAKTANILFSVELAEKLGKKGLLAYSLHPGAIDTNLGQYFTPEDKKATGWFDEQGKPKKNDSFEWKTLGEGASTYIVAAFDPSIADQNGVYLTDCQVAMDVCYPHAKDKGDAAKLWTLSEAIVGQEFSYGKSSQL